MYAVREFRNDCLLYSLDGILRYGEVLNVPQADERNRVVERKEVPLFNQIEILSKGLLPPKQTMDGFFAGESVPVNEKLARIILQLHISEQTGRGVPAIVDAYGKDAFRFTENNIRVTIPFDLLENEIDATVKKAIVPVNVPVGERNVLVKDIRKMADTSDKRSQEEKILVFCEIPKSVSEIAEYLGYKDKRSIRKRIYPLLEQGRIAMTVPDKPNSRLQKYITIK